MTDKRCHLLLFALLPALWSPTSAEDVPALEEYRIIVRNNIFDGNRGRPPPSPPPRPTPPPARNPDTIRLNGVLVIDERPVAICSGSRRDWNREVSVGQTLAGLAVIAIDTDTMTLQNADGDHLVIPVGASLVETEDSWTVTATAAGTADPPPGTAPSSSPEAAEDDASPDDLLQRLRERRMKELNQ